MRVKGGKGRGYAADGKVDCGLWKRRGWGGERDERCEVKERAVGRWVVLKRKNNEWRDALEV